jgi:hypothetical protein
MTLRAGKNHRMFYAVSLNGGFKELGWLISGPSNDASHDFTEVRTKAFAGLGIDVEAKASQDVRGLTE